MEAGVLCLLRLVYWPVVDVAERWPANGMPRCLPGADCPLNASVPAGRLMPGLALLPRGRAPGCWCIAVRGGAPSATPGVLPQAAGYSS